MFVSLVEIRNLSCRIGGGKILHDISLEVKEGETLVWVGRSGSGKTTLLKTVNGLIPPSAGAIRFAGIATAEWDPIQLRRRMGYVIQDSGLFPHWTVEANVGLVPRLEGWPPERIAQPVNELLPAVGLAPDECRARPHHPARLAAAVPRIEAQRAQDRALRHPRYPRSHDAGVAHRAAEGRRARSVGRTARVPRRRHIRSPRLPRRPGTESAVPGRGGRMNGDLASEMFSLSLEHITMVAITIAIASAIALPAGVALSRRPAPRRSP